MKTRAPESIDEYIDSLPANVQKILQKIRKTIQKAAPAAEEAISYQMPSFRLNGYLIYFAAHANHIGLYPAPRGAAEFKEELARYEGGKGTVQFKFDAPVPYDLIARIVKFRAQENMDKAAAKSKKRSSAKKSAKRTATTKKRAPTRKTSASSKKR